jgi:hypothetical protein
MLKIITCSATYRQQSHPRPELDDRDPKNVWLSRQNRVRLEAEIVRDAALSASDLLVRHIGGPSVRPPQPAGVSDLTYAGSARWSESTGPERYRRGLYTWFQRTSPYPMLMTFDAPESNVTCTRRERSNTPLQSLTLLNDPVFFECAQTLGQLAWKSAAGSPDTVLTTLYRRALGREPTLRKQPEHIPPLLAVPPAAEAKATTAPDESLGQATAILMARLILNLDEFITRE